MTIRMSDGTAATNSASSAGSTTVEVGVVRVAHEDQPGALGDRRQHGVQIVGVVLQGHRDRGGARGAHLQRVDLETAPAEHHLVAHRSGDLDELLAQAHRAGAHRDVLRGGEVHMLGQSLAQILVAVVRIPVDAGGGGGDGLEHAGQRTVHGFVAGDLDGAGHRTARRVGRKVGHFGAQAGGHPAILGGVRRRLSDVALCLPRSGLCNLCARRFRGGPVPSDRSGGVPERPNGTHC